MTNDVLVAFFIGMASGLVLGIVIASVLAAIANSIERGEKKEAPIFDREHHREYFRGRCPYTNEYCESWNCEKCVIEDRERRFMEEV